LISTNQFKNGTHIEGDGSIYRIIEFQHVKPARGGAFVRTKLRKIEDGSAQDKTLRAGSQSRGSPQHRERNDPASPTKPKVTGSNPVGPLTGGADFTQSRGVPQRS
jgi:hypothetical protein